MVQYHDENYALYQQWAGKGSYNRARFEALLNTIQDWDLFLVFTIIDGWTEGKDLAKLRWFIVEVGQFRPTRVDQSWVPA